MKNKYLDIPFEIKSDNITEEGIFSGFGSTFGGKPDSYGDIIVKGAFRETLEKGGRNGSGVAMLWQHNPHDPIGVWNELAETEKGLKVSGKLALKVQQGQEAFELMKMGALKGLSIGYDLMRDSENNVFSDAMEYDEKNKTRYLKRLELWEISPVTFPANTTATITQVKNAIEMAKNERELEHALCEAGLSNTASRYVVSLCKNSLRYKWKKVNVIREIYDALKDVNSVLSREIKG